MRSACAGPSLGPVHQRLGEPVRKASVGLRGAQAMVDGAYVHRDLGRHFRRHRGDLRHDRGCHLLAGLAILLIGGPLAALFASWPIALGQALRALADVAEYFRDQQQGVPAERLSEGEQVPRD